MAFLWKPFWNLQFNKKTFTFPIKLFNTVAFFWNICWKFIYFVKTWPDQKQNYWLNAVKVPETVTSCFFKEKLWNLKSSYYNSHIIVEDLRYLLWFKPIISFKKHSPFSWKKNSLIKDLYKWRLFSHLTTSILNG